MLFLVILLVPLVVLPARPANAEEPSGPCATPRAAALTWLSNLMPESNSPRKAAQCARASSDMNQDEKERAIIQLKDVIDARGISIKIDKLPDDANYVDPDTLEARVQISPSLPEIYLLKLNNGWYFPPSVLDQAEALHSRTFALFSVVDALPPWLQQQWHGVALWQLAGAILYVLLGLIVRWLVRKMVAWQMSRLATSLLAQPQNAQHDLFPSASSLGSAAMAMLISWSVPSLDLPRAWAAVSVLASRVFAASFLVLFFYRAVDVLAAELQARAEKAVLPPDGIAAKESAMAAHLVGLLRRLLQVAVVSLGAIFILHNMNVDVRSLVAGLGIGGVAVALAAKDTLSHLFGSAVIFLDRPFQVGDWVIIGGTGGVEGSVEEVGFRSSKVRTFDDTVVIIPNAKLIEGNVENYGLRRHRRINMRFCLGHETKPEEILRFCERIKKMIADDDAHFSDEELLVQMMGVTERGLDIRILCFSTAKSWVEEQRIRHRLWTQIYEVVLDEKLRFAQDFRFLLPPNNPDRTTSTGITPPTSSDAPTSPVQSAMTTPTALPPALPPAPPT